MMTWAEYLAHPSANVSSLLHLAKSPAHYRHVKSGGEVTDTAAMALGRLVHVAVLEPDRYSAEVAVWDGGRRGTNAHKAWCEDNAGRLQVTEDEHELCMAISSAVREHPVAGAYLDSRGIVAEHTVLWRHRGTGIECKARFDAADFDRNVIIDLKTARDASEFGFGRAAARLSYHVRAAFYCDGYVAAYGHEPRFVLIAVEKTPPYAVAVYRVPTFAIESGRTRYEELLGKLHGCLAADEWRGLNDDQELELHIPDWAIAGDDDLELEFADGEVLRVS